MSATSYPIDRKGKLIGESVTVEVQLQKISLTGISVESPKKARIGTRLKVEFEIPAFGYIHELSLYSIVTHLHNTPTGYFLTLDFDIISPEEKAMIKDFIAYKARLRELGQHHYTQIEN